MNQCKPFIIFVGTLLSPLLFPLLFVCSFLPISQGIVKIITSLCLFFIVTKQLFFNEEGFEDLKAWKQWLILTLYVTVLTLLVFRMLTGSPICFLGYLLASWAFSTAIMKSVEKPLGVESHIIYGCIFFNYMNVSYLQIKGASLFSVGLAVFLMGRSVWRLIKNLESQILHRRALEEGKEIEVENISPIRKALFGRTGKLRIPGREKNK